MRIGSLFSGIGGLDLGLERAGVGRTVWQVEQDAWCRGVLAQHWPDAARYEDVREVGAHNLEQVEVICGGFPCQDLSIAGLRAGLDGARSGLWWEMRRIISEIRPRYVVLENVAAIVADDAAGVVLGSLAALGYDAAWGVVHAADVGAPHLRARWFCVAWLGDAAGAGREALRPRALRPWAIGQVGLSGDPVADAVRPGRREQHSAPLTGCVGQLGRRGDAGAAHGLAERGLGRGVDGLPTGLDRWPARPGEAQHAWEPPRTTDASDPSRNRRLKALGNAVVPAVAEVIGQWLLTIHEGH